MIDYELTDLLIELEEIQESQSFNLARGQQVADLLDFYDIPEQLYTLKQEPANGRPPEQCRRKIACFNFGLITSNQHKAVIECLFVIGHAPEFIAEAMGEDVRYVAETLSNLVENSRTKQAAELRKNPQRFRLVES